ncbi:MAG TPA: hypothetical protein VEZ71_02985, partial [Archangium sp.]|nr:hypothetical protein [Archangium sp.]
MDASESGRASYSFFSRSLPSLAIVLVSPGEQPGRAGGRAGPPCPLSPGGTMAIPFLHDTPPPVDAVAALLQLLEEEAE